MYFMIFLVKFEKLDLSDYRTGFFNLLCERLTENSNGLNIEYKVL